MIYNETKKKAKRDTPSYNHRQVVTVNQNKLQKAKENQDKLW